MLLNARSGFQYGIFFSSVSILHMQSYVLQRFETQVQNFPGVGGLLDPGSLYGIILVDQYPEVVEDAKLVL